MSHSASVLEELLQARPDLHSQMYFKSSLTALSHAMEDQVLAGHDRPLVIASFQRERFYRQEANRYLRIAARTDQVYVLAAPETDFANCSAEYETVAFDPTDTLAKEWHLVVIGPHYSACLICQEREGTGRSQPKPAFLTTDQARRFDGIWSFDRRVVAQAAHLLLERILNYRPELQTKLAAARTQLEVDESRTGFTNVDPGPFADRLVTYLQAGQYKLLKAYRSIAAQERKERLVNSITSAVRRSLKPDEIFNVAVQELGQALAVCRCLLYPCKGNETQITVTHEYRSRGVKALMGQSWALADNPLVQAVVERQEILYVLDAQDDPWVLHTGETLPSMRSPQAKLRSWLIAPVIHQNRLLGLIELHTCGQKLHDWANAELELVEAIATQIGVALIQAESYANLETLNEQLEALDRTRSNLIAITGHELRTPLSTIQVCLESLSTEPDMVPEMRQVMIQSALEDADRMRELVQDFLTLSELESGRVKWHVEPLHLDECIDLALSSIRARQRYDDLPQIDTDIAPDLPLVQSDGEWLVEVLSKLLDNACKFTPPTGTVTIHAQQPNPRQLKVTVADTGRGIERDRLEAIFDRFYQAEGALRRTAGGTGLGLAICRQIISNLGGEIWAESAGKDQGSQFHFTLPCSAPPPIASTKPRAKRRKSPTVG